MQLNINGQAHTIAAEWQQDALLWVLREALALTGTKYGCGQGQCGACTVWVDGEPQRACLLPVAALTRRSVTTIEGLARGAGVLHPLQQAWIDEAVPQCGYCQAGQLMAAAALLASVPQPTPAQIDTALSGHLCRCGTQMRVRRAVLRVAATAAGPRP